jgi:hypothetical protein
MDRAKRFDVLCRLLGLSREDAAQLLQVSIRTLHNWCSGQVRVPFMAFKCLRLLHRQELPGKDWEGWHFSRGVLWSPEGHGFSGRDSAWWSLLVRQARCFRLLYQERNELQSQLDRERAARQVAQRGTPSARGPASSAAQSALVTMAEAGDLAGLSDVRYAVTPHSSLTGEISCPAQGRLSRARQASQGGAL